MNDRSDLSDFLQAAWRHLTRGVADRKAPARHPTFATVSPEGRPEARTVVLRGADPGSAMLEVHTDRATSKIRALEHAPFAAFHVWVPQARMQIRLTTQVEIITGADVLDRWNQVPVGSRISYGTEPDPGTPIEQVDAYQTPGSADRFAVLKCHVHEIDVVDLHTPHRRARFQREDGWQGVWLAP